MAKKLTKLPVSCFFISNLFILFFLKDSSYITFEFFINFDEPQSFNAYFIEESYIGRGFAYHTCKVSGKLKETINLILFNSIILNYPSIKETVTFIWNYPL